MSEPRSGAEEQEPTTLPGAEGLDADELGGDPVEQGVEPPEHWSAETRDRPTPRSEREGESLDEHLAEEVPDIEPEQPRNGIDESIDDRAAEEEGF
ncbi:hypothetical protein ACWEV3_07725 [Saccharopolyspora sp. NPDC003752]